MVPGDELAAGVEARLDVVRRHRAELAAGQIVLASPDQLDRLADRLGEAHGVEHDVLLAAASEAAAEKMLVEGDVGALRLQQARDLVDARWSGAWVPAQISADLPSGLTAAVAFSGSIWAW